MYIIIGEDGDEPELMAICHTKEQARNVCVALRAGSLETRKAQEVSYVQSRVGIIYQRLNQLETETSAATDDTIQKFAQCLRMFAIHKLPLCNQDDLVELKATAERYKVNIYEHFQHSVPLLDIASELANAACSLGALIKLHQPDYKLDLNLHIFNTGKPAYVCTQDGSQIARIRDTKNLGSPP
jgi:hypothetical protein